MEYRQQVYDFAEKYMDYFLDIRTTKEDLEEAGFGNACFNLGFGADGGRKFIVMCHDSNAFDDTDDLARVIDKVDNINVLGSAVSAKWDMAETLDEHTRMWMHSPQKTQGYDRGKRAYDGSGAQRASCREKR